MVGFGLIATSTGFVLAVLICLVLAHGDVVDLVENVITFVAD